MNKEINKPNDIFVSTVLNGDVGFFDLTQNGITAANTQLLSPETYKESSFVKNNFSDENGAFDESKFMSTYVMAAKQYQDLLNDNLYKNIENYIEYNQNDIFAKPESKKATVGYEISTELNPTRRSHGVSSLFEYGKVTNSMRELAQQSKIWDYDNQVWLDKTADDRGLLGSLFGQSLVYATWDEDGVHEDALTGRKIQHKKGDWKLNDKGQYYTETIGNRSGRGKQFVVATDTLTKEGSTLNKIDFFDSDDLEKSTIGTTFKAIAAYAPYLFPGTQLVWGGITAALALNKALPAFAKMVEGIATGGDADEESAFTRAMNKWENYFSKFDDSYSDKGNSSNWSYEKIANVVTDVFGQLYQMQAAASLSKLMMKDPTKKALSKFEKEILPQVIQGAYKPNSGISLTNDELGKIALLAAQKSPEVQAAIKAQSALSKALSTGYMALTSTSDVYNEALNGGYDRRMAGLAGLAAAAGQYAIMGTTGLGDWFLNKNVGYSEHANRQVLLKALRPYYDDVKAAVDKLESAASSTEKQKILGGVFNKIGRAVKKAWHNFESDGAMYWKNAVTESIEEVTEEAVLDATKAVFDFLTWAGIGNPNASFGVAQDFTSGSFLERYIQSAFGGFVGGALFEFQQKKVDPFMKEKLHGVKAESIQPSLIHEIANGRTQDLLLAIKDITKLDSEASSLSVDINGNLYQTSAEGGMSRGQVIDQVLTSYVKMLEGAVIDENANLTDEQILQKSIRDYQALKLLKQGGMDKLLISDFTKLSSEIVSIKSELAKFESKKSDKEKKSEEQKDTKDTPKVPEKIEEYDDGVYNNKSEEFLKKLLEEKRKELTRFLNGDKGEEYLYKTLVGLTPEIRTALGNISIYDYTYLKYGKEWKDLPEKKGVLTHEKIQKEYDEWKQDTDLDRKFIKFGVEAYADADKRFAQYAIKYIQENYGSITDVVMSKVLSRGNLTINTLLDNNDDYQYIKQIADALKADSLQESGEGTKSEGNVTLQHIFKQDVLQLKNVITRIIDANPQFVKILEKTGKTKDQIIEGLSKSAQWLLENISIDNLHGSALSIIFQKYFQSSMEAVIDEAIQISPNKTLGEVQQYMLENGFISTPFADGESLFITDPLIIKDSILKLFTINPEDYNIGLATSVLQEYVTSESSIDGNIFSIIQEHALRSILNTLVGTERLALFAYNDITDDSSLDLMFEITSDQLKQLIDKVNNEFGTKSMDSIIEEWAQKSAEEAVASMYAHVPQSNIYASELYEAGWDPSTLKVEDVARRFKSFIKDKVDSISNYQLYKTAKSKNIKQNPIFEALKSIDMHLSESGPSKVLDVLQRQHFQIRKAELFGDYLPRGEEKIQLENALRAVELLQSVLVGMSDGPLGIGNPFAVNQQMNRYLKNNNKTSSREYQTIDAESAKLMNTELAIIKQELMGYLQLAERSYSNKAVIDKEIKKSYSKSLLSYITEKASAFTIDDFSLLPSDDEVVKYKTPEDILLFYAHSIYQNFNKHFKTPAEKQKAIKQLIQNLGLEKLTRESRPSNLNREIKVANSYDITLWLASALGGDAYEFYHRYNNEFLSNSKENLVPLFSQTQAAWQAWSFTRSDYNVQNDKGESITIHEAILREVASEDGQFVISPHTIFVNGITGAGKTNAVSRVVSRLNSDKIQFVTAPNESQQKKYAESLKKGHPQPDHVQGGSITDLLKMFLTEEGLVKLKSQIQTLKTKTSLDGYTSAHSEWLFIKKTVNGKHILEVNEEFLETLLRKDIAVESIPELVFIDEATQVDVGIIKVLSSLAKRYRFKMPLSGDSTQRGAKELGDTQAIKDLMGWTTAKLNISIRALNNQKASNNVAYNAMLEEYESRATRREEDSFDDYLKDPKNHQVISYYQDENNFNGDKFVESLSQASEDIKHIAKLNKSLKGKVIVITKLKPDGQPENADLVSTLTNNGLETGEYVFYSFEDAHKKAVQGAEADYVIVDNSYLADPGNSGELLRSVYTFASRSLRGSLMVLPIEKQRILNLSNRKDKFTQPDEIPQLANLDKIKEETIKELEVHLKNYAPEQAELLPLNIIEVNGQKVARRRGVKPTTTSSTTKKSTITVPKENANAEQENEFSEEDKAVINQALNSEVHDNASGMSNKVHTETGKKELKHYDRSMPVRMYGAMDHLGVPVDPSTSGGYSPLYDNDDPTRNIGLDMDSMFSTLRYISAGVRTGYIKFRYAIMTAENKQDIADAIQDDPDIVKFLLEALPTIAKNAGLSDVNVTDEHASLYSTWFLDHVHIDDNYYVFAKSLNWDVDKPSTKNASYANSVQNGNTVLYYGIHMYSDDNPDAPLFNHYISVGTLSDRKFKNKEGELEDIGSAELQALYNTADADLLASEHKFIAYRLPNTKMYDMPLASTLWIRQVVNENVDDVYTTIAKMQADGVHIDTEQIYLVDQSKVMVDGKEEYAALVYAAMVGSTSGEINPDTHRPYTFKEKLEKLKETFIIDNELIISGSYMTMAKMGYSKDSDSTKRKAYRRLLFLSPKKHTIDDVFKSLTWSKNNELFNWRSRLHMCRPHDQIQIIAESLRQAHAFGTDDHGQSNIDTLYKFLIGLRNTLSKQNNAWYNSDKALVQELIEWVDSIRRSNGTISKQEFLDFINQSKNKNRILLFPFFTTFIVKDGDTYKIADIAKESIVTLNDIDQLKEIKKSKTSPVKLDLSGFSLSRSCPPLTGAGSDKINLLDVGSDQLESLGIMGTENIELKFFQVQNYKGITSDLGMYGYELQMPVYSIKNEQLQIDPDRDRVPELLRRVDDSVRFTKRSVHNAQIPAKPDDFDPSKYQPEKLSESNYIFDPSYEQYAGWKEKSKTKWKWDKKKKKPVPVKDGSKGKKGSKDKTKKSEKVFTGWRIKKGKNTFKMTYKNAMGFEIRQGDVVQLWGHSDVSFKIVAINASDPKNIKIRVGAVGNSNGDFLEDFTPKELTIDAVTKIVKRTLPSKEYIKLDYYYKGNFDIRQKYAEGVYGQVEKTADTITEMMDEAEDNPAAVPSLDFDKYVYFISPITQLGGSDEFSRLDTILRDSGGVHLVTSLDSLRDYHLQIAEQEGLGYSLFRVSIDAYHLKDEEGNIKNFDQVAVINDLQKKIDEAANPSDPSKQSKRSTIIQHHVFFDEDQMNELIGRYRAAHPATAYVHDDVAQYFTDPAEIFQFKDGELDLEALYEFRAGFIEVSYAEYTNRSNTAFPDSEFIREEIRDKVSRTVLGYKLYPKYEFYFAKDPKDKKYKYTSPEGAGILDHVRIKAALRQRTNAVDNVAYWSNLLSGLHLKDRQGEAYEAKVSKDNGISAEQIQRAKSILYQTPGSIPLAGHIKYTISGVQMTDKGDLTVHLIKDGESEPSVTIGLEKFLIQFGSRFILEDKTRSTIYAPKKSEVIVKPVTLTAPSTQTELEPDVRSASESTTEQETTDDTTVDEEALLTTSLAWDEVTQKLYGSGFTLGLFDSRPVLYNHISAIFASHPIQISVERLNNVFENASNVLNVINSLSDDSHKKEFLNRILTDPEIDVAKFTDFVFEAKRSNNDSVLDDLMTVNCE